MDTDKILAEANLGAAVENAIVEMQQLINCDRRVAKVVLSTISREKEKVASEILNAGATNGMDAMVGTICKEIRSQTYIQEALMKIDL